MQQQQLQQTQPTKARQPQPRILRQTGESPQSTRLPNRAPKERKTRPPCSNTSEPMWLAPTPTRYCAQSSARSPMFTWITQQVVKRCASLRTTLRAQFCLCMRIHTLCRAPVASRQITWERKPELSLSASAMQMKTMLLSSQGLEQPQPSIF